MTLEHVTARATYGDGVYIVGHSQGITIQDCTLDHNGRQGVAVVDGVDITVQRCSIIADGPVRDRPRAGGRRGAVGARAGQRGARRRPTSRSRPAARASTWAMSG